ncbi:hypothetical protein GCM10023116_02820 [Kistimonas scapharcae]|uniref:Histidine kinase n=1 Tax=Kistimonas scapharcae TaxID=1036133 RepID=A0ABP8UYU4_9GAMM
MIEPTLLEKLVDESNDGIVVAEREGDENVLIYTNAAFERLTGYSSEEILYQDCRFLQKEDRCQDAIQRIREALKQDQPTCEVVRNYRKDGSMFWNELRITPVFNDDDQLMYYIGIQKDVTEQMEAREKIEALEQEIEALKSKIASLEGGK